MDEKNQKKEVASENSEVESNVKKTKQHTVFQITAMILTILLIVAVFIEIFIIVGLKNKTDNLNDKNNRLPTSTSVVFFCENRPQ